MFASEEEALAAATEAYAAYQQAVDGALTTYEIDRLSKVSVGTALEEAVSSVAEFVESDQRQFGSSAVKVVSIVDASSLVDGSELDQFLQIYACLDLGGTDVLDGEGRSVVPAGSARVYPLIATLTWSDQASRLLVSSEESWDGKNFCA
ncbi:hypothetical protein GCM10027057_05730 [Marisediminicola antarctica]